MTQRAQIVRHARQNLFATQSQARHHVDRGIDRQLSRLHALEGGTDPAQNIHVKQSRVPIAFPRRFQSLRQIQLFLAVEERNCSHLPKVKTKGIVRGLSRFRFRRFAGWRLFLIGQVQIVGSRFLAREEWLGLVERIAAYRAATTFRPFAEAVLSCNSLSFLDFHLRSLSIPFHVEIPRFCLCSVVSSKPIAAFHARAKQRLLSRAVQPARRGPPSPLSL